MSKFMFRTKELKRILNAWKEGRSILLVGIRRTGKSKLMKEALRQQQAHSSTKYLDVQDYTQLHAFYRDLLTAMPKSVMETCLDTLKQAGSLPTTLLNWLRTHVDKVSGLGIEIDLNTPENQERLVRYWESVVQALLQTLEKQRSDQLPVIAIDELPFMLETLIKLGVSNNEITIALASLRKLRDAGLRMIIGGSISLENLLTLHQIPHTVLGGLTREVLPPFTREEALCFLETRLQGRPALEKIEAALDKLPDYVAEYLVITVHSLSVLEADEDVELTMDTQVLPAIRRSFLEQFQERLSKNYDAAELATANAILDHLARQAPSGGPLNLATLPPNAIRVITKLQYDMFLEEAPRLGYRFTLQLLRQWWQSQRGIQE